MFKEDKVIVRGGGDLATGVIQKLYHSGIPILVLEVPKPTAIRRTVALCEAVYAGTYTVEEMTARRIQQVEEAASCWEQGEIPILIDPLGESVQSFQPTGVIDAILAKKNLGTTRALAPITIALGPGFHAPSEVDVVIETMRGHDLGRLLWNGTALPNTGTPGEIGGQSAQRVVHAPISGCIRHVHSIGDVVTEGEVLFFIDHTPVTAPFTGLLRGLIREGFSVKKGMKIADVDPRLDVDWRTISDKARCLGGAALEAYLYLRKKDTI